MQAAVSESDDRSSISKNLANAIAVVALGGIVVSGLSLYHHFGKTKTSFCTFGESFNCDLVNRSVYSTVLGVPVALVGILGYLLILALATVYHERAETPLMLVIASGGGLAFALYLTYIEKFVLQAWCVLCLASLALILSTTALSAILLKRSLSQNGET